MKLASTVFALLVATTLGISQPGFMEKYDFGSGASFHNVLLHGDTLIIAGTTFDLELNQWGALLVKMDTLGTILDYKLHLDTIDGGSFVFSNGEGLIHTEDGGYFMSSVIFFVPSYSLTLIKLNAEGDLEFTKKHELGDVFTILPKKIVETQGGYLIAGSVQELNYRMQFFLKKVDYQGNELWEKRYGEDELTEGLGDFIQIHENLFVLAGGRTSSFTGSYIGNWTRSYIIGVDSLGEVQWEWQSEKDVEGAVISIVQSPEGNWVYNTEALDIYDSQNFGLQPKVVCRDQDFNLIWERVISPTSWDCNRNYDLVLGPDGNWVAAARWVLPSAPLPGSTDSEYRWKAASLHKISPEGDSIWSRTDTMPVGNQTYNHEYGAIVVLPSGSTIAVGSFEQATPTPGDKSWAWVVKVDKDGCLEELCSFTSVQDLEKRKPVALSVAPNPASDYVIFEFENKPPVNGILTVVNAAGQEVWKISVVENSAQIRWETAGAKSGIYFYRFHSDTGIPTEPGRFVLIK